MNRDLAASPEHALVWGLRSQRDEAQVTNVIAAIAATDADFAFAFAEALVAQAFDDCPHTRAAVQRALPVPKTIHSGRERTLYDRAGSNLGRVDLSFDSTEEGDEYTLLVENKLYSGFGPEQLSRYRAGLRVVRGGGGRGAIIAVTRDVPTQGELQAIDPEWLGSVRWARLLPRLRKLPVSDDAVGVQWQLLLDVLDEQGDLGMTTIDGDAVRAWARSRTRNRQA